MAVVSSWEFAVLLLDSEGCISNRHQKGVSMDFTIPPHSCVSLCVLLCVTERERERERAKKSTQGLGNGTVAQCQLAQSSPSHYQMDSHKHRPHTHTHTHTEQPPAWVGWRAESTSAIPERHPALQKDTHTHAHTFWASGAHGQIGTVVKLAPSL